MSDIVKTGEMGPEPEIKKYESLDKVASIFNKKFKRALEFTLHIMWVLGGQIKLASEENCYGSGAVSKLAEKMGMSDSTLYGYKSLHEKVSWEDLNNIYIPAKIAYRNVDKILRLPKEEREDLLSKAKDLTPKELSKILDDSKKSDFEDAMDIEATDLDKKDGKEIKDVSDKPQDKGRSLVNRYMKAHDRVDRVIELMDELIDTTSNDLDEAAGDPKVYKLIEEEIRALYGKCNSVIEAFKEYKKFFKTKADVS